MKKVTFIKFIKVLLCVLAAFGIGTFLSTLDALYPEKLTVSIGVLVGTGLGGLGIGFIILGVIDCFKNKNNKNNEDKHNKNNDVCTI